MHTLPWSSTACSSNIMLLSILLHDSVSHSEKYNIKPLKLVQLKAVEKTRAVVSRPILHLVLYGSLNHTPHSRKSCIELQTHFIRESVDSLCRDGSGPPMVCVHWKAVLTRERSCSKPFWTPSYPIRTFLYSMIPPK